MALFLILLLAVTLVSLAVYLQHRAELARTAALAAVAAQLGWRFDGTERDRGFAERHADFEIFRRGRARTAHNRLFWLLTVPLGELRAEAGDYFYKETRGGGKSRRTVTYRLSYLLVALPYGRRMPELALRPEGLFDKLAGAIGFEDIDYESAEFSRRYHVSASERKFAYDLIHPRMLEWMLEKAPPAFEVRSGWLLVHSGSARWEPAEFSAVAGWTRDFLGRWPDYLMRDLAARGAAEGGRHP